MTNIISDKTVEIFFSFFVFQCLVIQMQRTGKWDKIPILILNNHIIEKQLLED